MKTTCLLLLLICFGTIQAQNIFEEFKTNKDILDSNIRFRNGNVDSLFSEQNRLLNTIHANYDDSSDIYLFHFFDSKYTFFGKDHSIQTQDSLGFYSEKLMRLANKIDKATFKVKAFGTRALYFQITHNREKGIRLGKVAVELAKAANDYTLIGSAYCDLIFFLYGNGNLLEADSLVDAFSTKIDNLGPEDKTCFCVRAGTVKMLREDHKASYAFLLQALPYSEQQKDTGTLVAIYSLIASNHVSMEEPLKTIEYCNKAIELSLNRNKRNEKNLGRLYYFKSIAYFRDSCSICVKNNDSVHYYINLASDAFLGIEDTLAYYTLTGLRARVLMEKNEYQDAINAVLQALKFKMKKNYYVGAEYDFLVKCYTELNKYDSAIYYGELGLPYAQKRNSPKFLRSFYVSLSNLYEQTGDYKKALFYTKEAQARKDSLYRENRIIEIANLESNFEIEIHKQEKEHLKEEVRQNAIIQQKDKRIKQYLGVVIISGAILFSALVFILLIRNQSKKRQLVLNRITIEKQQLAHRALNNKLIILKEKLVLESRVNAKQANEVKNLPSNEDGMHLTEKIKTDNNWLEFMNDFNKTYGGFIDKLKAKYPQITNHDTRIAAFIKLGISNKEGAELLVVSDWGIKKSKSRLRDKLGLKKSSEIQGFIDSFIEKYCV